MADPRHPADKVTRVTWARRELRGVINGGTKAVMAWNFGTASATSCEHRHLPGFYKWLTLAARRRDADCPRCVSGVDTRRAPGGCWSPIALIRVSFARYAAFRPDECLGVARKLGTLDITADIREHPLCAIRAARDRAALWKGIDATARSVRSLGPFLRKEAHGILLSGRGWSIGQRGIPIGADGPFQLVSRFNDVQHDDAFRVTNADERRINQATPMRSPCFCWWSGKIYAHA